MFCKAKGAVCSDIHTKHVNAAWALPRIFGCYSWWYVKLPLGLERLIWLAWWIAIFLWFIVTSYRFKHDVPGCYKPGTELISELFCYSYRNTYFVQVRGYKYEIGSYIQAVWVRTQTLLDWFARCYLPFHPRQFRTRLWRQLHLCLSWTGSRHCMYSKTFKQLGCICTRAACRGDMLRAWT
jgi:hypothetical protein